MIDAPSPKSRSFSKRLTVASLAANTLLAFYGIAAESAYTAEILAILGPTSVVHLLLYMGTGHLDFRAVLGQSFGDILRGYMKSGRDPKPRVEPTVSSEALP